MANPLTGDYRYVVKMTAGSVNRILAGMHAANRFPHSISPRVDDVPDAHLTIKAGIDWYTGEALTDMVAVRQFGRVAARPAVSLADTSRFDEWGRAHGVVVSTPAAPRAAAEPERYGNLRGGAQLQLFSPTISLPGDGGTRAAVRTRFRAMYQADPGTPELPRFFGGALVCNFQINSRNTASGNFIEVAADGDLEFEQEFPREPLTESQMQAIQKSIRNALAGGFHPSTAPLPGGVSVVHCKTIVDRRPTIAVMIDSGEEGTIPDPSSVRSTFLAADDQFAVAIHGGWLTGQLAAAIDSAVAADRERLSRTNLGGEFSYEIWPFTFGGRADVYVDILPARVELLSEGGGLVRITLPIHPRISLQGAPPCVSIPDFSFTIAQSFQLSVDAAGIGFAAVGDPVVDIPSGIDGRVQDPIRSQAPAQFRGIWSRNRSAILEEVNRKLSGSGGLQQLLSSLLNPSRPAGYGPPLTPVAATLEYTAVEVRDAGLVLHGRLSLPPWPAAVPEFSLNPWTAGTLRQEYTALNSWIPGGSVDEFVWSPDSGDPEQRETKTFLGSGPPWGRMCLEVRGHRLPASGSTDRPEPVSASTCCWLRDTVVALPAQVNPSLTPMLPTVLTLAGQLPGASQQPAVTQAGHQSIWADPSKQYTANLLVHFPDEPSADGDTKELAAALAKSGRKADTATAIVSVLTPRQMRKAAHHPPGGILLSDDAEGWEKLFDVKKRPTTILVSPEGKVVWRSGAHVRMAELTELLKKHLVPGAWFRTQLVRAGVRVGQFPPDFVFDAGGGARLSLQKMAGQEVLLLFWRSSSRISLQMIEHLERAARMVKTTFPRVLAIHDGADERKAAASRLPGAGNKALAATTVVPDPERKISLAYGVSMWPTAILVGTDGRVRDIRLGAIPNSNQNASKQQAPMEAMAAGWGEGGDDDDDNADAAAD